MRNYFETTLRVHPHPIRLSPEFSINPLPVSPSFGSFRRGFLFHNQRDFQLPACFPANLFTPNTIRQPAETKGQIEEYRKDREEEAKELESERNRVLSSSDGFTDVIDTGESRNIENYVRVKARNFNYSYTN